MRQRLSMLGFLVLLIGSLIVAGLLAQTAPMPAVAISPPLVATGQTYTIVWNCAVIVAGDQIGPVCFSEHLTVQAIRSDGWLLVTDQKGDGWTVNPNRAIGLKLATQPLRAVADLDRVR